MQDALVRLEMLVGEEKVASLWDKRVLVFGLGGVGGHCVDALSRSGIGHFGIVDHDVVSISNINRQLIATRSSIGKKKVDVMEAHLLDINPDIKVQKYDLFYLPETADSIDFSSYDYVVDCIDTVAAKVEIIERCYKLGVPVISALGCGNKLDPTQLAIKDIFETSNDPLAKVLRQKLRKLGIPSLKVVTSLEQPMKPLFNPEEKHVPGSSAFVPSSAGILMAKAVIFDLLNM